MPKCVCVVYDVWCVYMSVVLIVVFFLCFVYCVVCVCVLCVFLLCVGEKLGFLGTEPRLLSGKGPSLLLY